MSSWVAASTALGQEAAEPAGRYLEARIAAGALTQAACLSCFVLAGFLPGCLFVSQEMKIDDVDKVWDEINDQTDQMRQIQDAMAQPIGAAADIDEDELLGELEVRPRPCGLCSAQPRAASPRVWGTGTGPTWERPWVAAGNKRLR